MCITVSREKATLSRKIACNEQSNYFRIHTSTHPRVKACVYLTKKRKNIPRNSSNSLKGQLDYENSIPWSAYEMRSASSEHTIFSLATVTRYENSYTYRTHQRNLATYRIHNDFWSGHYTDLRQGNAIKDPTFAQGAYVTMQRINQPIRPITVRTGNNCMTRPEGCASIL